MTLLQNPKEKFNIILFGISFVCDPEDETYLLKPLSPLVSVTPPYIVFLPLSVVVTSQFLS